MVEKLFSRCGFLKVTRKKINKIEPSNQNVSQKSESNYLSHSSC